MSYEQYPPQRPKRKRGLPTWAGVLAFLGIIGTILGVITGVIALVQFGQGILNPAASPADQGHVYETLAALQVASDRQSLQLTQFFLEGQNAANQGTSNAVAAQAANVQGTLSAYQAQQDAVVGTQNAIVGQTATSQAAEQAAAGTATQNYLDTGATNAALSQIAPTNTPQPTPTDTPAPVADYRSLTNASAASQPDGHISLSVQAAQDIPPQAPTGLAYVWMLDTDHNPATGLAVQDIGVDLKITARFDNGAWLGTVSAILVDGSEGPGQVFTDVTVAGNTLTVTIDPSQYNIQPSFDWLSRAQSDQETYPLIPASGHLSFP